MRLARAILALSTAVITLAGVSAISADPPETSGAEPALAVAVPANGDHCLGADVGPDPETALQAEAMLAALDDSCFGAGSDPASEAVGQGACDQEVRSGPPPSLDPQKFLCIDVWDGDCFAGCCGPRGRARRWAQCCAEAGGPCSAECQTTCIQQYCDQGPR